jgi:tetratricopeptide (TPR) repeat protein
VARSTAIAPSRRILAYPHYAVPGEGDLPFAIGLLLYEMEDYEDALEFFEASLEQHGPDAATEHNIALCEAQLD